MATPTGKDLRRMTAPAGSLSLPEGPPRPSGRPPSPLRNGYTANSATGIDPDMDSESDDDDDDDDPHAGWHERSPSPSSSVSQFAAQFAQRVGSFVGGIAQSPMTSSRTQLPTDAELEAEAERERDRTRREAERIMNFESREHVQNRVMAMLDEPKTLPPPPIRSQSLPDPPSPSGSQKEGLTWWTAAKNRLTPTKEPLTPAQQVIQDHKTKEKQVKKLKKKSGEPLNTEFIDPSFQNLGPPSTPPRRPIPSSASPSPVRPGANMQINMTPSPMRQSPARAPGETTPLYAQFNSDGALDVPSTLLTIAKRFEKLEKWTVGHVRALEERMNDVERWLVDQEDEKEKNSIAASQNGDAKPRSDEEIRELREEIAELQGRFGELGREMANLATKNLSSGPTKQSGHLQDGARLVSSVAVHSQTGSFEDGFPVTPSRHQVVASTARESTSPPMGHNKTPTGGTRRPYPTGDYTSPEPTSSMIRASSPSSPPPRPVASTQPLSIPGLPSSSSGNAGLGIVQPSSASSYSSGNFSAASSMSDLGELSAPKMPVSAPPRQESSSPTPRKRYTVALGAPITNPNSRISSPPPRHSVYSQALSTSPALSDNRDLASDEEDDALGGETIGKSAAARLNNRSNEQQRPSRVRPQSTYAGFSTLQTPLSPTKPLRPRSHSQDRFASSESLNSLSSVTSTGSKFVDPLIQRRAARKETMDKLKSTAPKVEKGRKVPVGQLVAFFDPAKAL
ncbi:hypothetical protein DL96DRAFT_1605517 [Flagelloscypha sp. PMI_526]|nr:hypothetical protein DL96DRAFT_1605517 [Flagelloscypha sp. PMI_526]